MNNINVYIIVEGQTEQTFVRDLLAPEFGKKGIFLNAVLLGKPGQKGGNVRFDRAKTHIDNFLKQQPHTYVSTMFDFYGIDPAWPGRADVRNNDTAGEKALKLEKETVTAIQYGFPGTDITKRFIPYIEIHEFEALLFSDPEKLALEIQVEPALIDNIIKECGEPEEINDNPQTAPSKRIQSMCPGNYRKIQQGNKIAKSIGLPAIRSKCPHFNDWLNKLESLTI